MTEVYVVVGPSGVRWIGLAETEHGAWTVALGWPDVIWQGVVQNKIILHFDQQPPYVEIYTLEGVIIGSLGDWIIQGVKGEFYSCKPDIFDKTYEAVP